MNDVHPLIAAALAAPKTHRVVTRFASGETREHETRSLATAENYAFRERRKIGRDLIELDRVTLKQTGRTVRIVGVDIEKIAA